LNTKVYFTPKYTNASKQNINKKDVPYISKQKTTKEFFKKGNHRGSMPQMELPFVLRSALSANSSHQKIVNIGQQYANIFCQGG
jgi:hypothetical protein